MKILSRHRTLKTIYENFKIDWFSTRHYKLYNFSRGHLYELSYDGYLDHSSVPPTVEIYKMGNYSEKISGYWCLTENGLNFLYNTFKELRENIKNTKKYITKNRLKSENLRPSSKVYF